MAYTEFYCDASTGANVNGGSDAGSPSMSDTAGTGTWNGTNTYTSVATNGTVAVGQFLSIYSGAATVAAYTARITGVTGGSGVAWVITLSTTAISGAAPSLGSTYKAQCGGAWKGPNSAVNFPAGYTTNALVNSSGNPVRINLRNTSNYAISAAVALTKAGVTFEGCTTTAADGGIAVFDCGGNSIKGIIFGALAGQNITLKNVQGQNNAGGNSMFDQANGPAARIIHCISKNSSGIGFALSNYSPFVSECEAYGGTVGFFCNSSVGFCLHRCIAHDNSGNGFQVSANDSTAVMVINQCISESNGGKGIIASPDINLMVFSCDIYNNTSNGIDLTGNANASAYIENCNFVKNGGTGVAGHTSGTSAVILQNCGFGVGTQANGADTSGPSVQNNNSVSYATGVTPWTDPANGDFRVNLAAAKQAGRGAFTETASSYAGSVSYEDIGACRHIDPTAGGSPIIGSAIVRGLGVTQ